MSPTALTGWVLVAVALVLFAWEIYTLANRQEGDHITAVVRKAARKNLLIPFGMGLLMGHLFWCN